MQTLQSLKKYDINYAGRIHFQGTQTNTVFTKTIRGIPLALHAYNLYNRFSGDMENYCSELTQYTTQ